MVGECETKKDGDFGFFVTSVVVFSFCIAFRFKFGGFVTVIFLFSNFIPFLDCILL